MLDNFFNPKSVAVIGASSDTKKVGFALVKNLQENTDRKIYPVNLAQKEIPVNVDLAIIAVRADLVPDILIECGNKNISNAIVISSGFKEAGGAGKMLEDKIAEIAKAQNILLLGPNCLGVIDTKNNLNASFAMQKPLTGKIALLSQSGALGTAMLDWSLAEGVGFSKFISLGNEALLNEIDFLKYLKDDPDTEAVMIYLEKVSDGREFMNLIKDITQTKPVIIIKAGVSSRGAEAVRSHTGSLAPTSAVFLAACRQAGAFTVASLREFFNVAKLLTLGFDINAPIKNLVVLTNGGGPSVVATDLIENSRSLSLIELSTETQNALKTVLPPMAAIGNPIDIIGDALAERYDKALEILCGIKEIDGIIVLLTPQMMTEPVETAKVLAKYSDNKKILPVFMGGPNIHAGANALKELGLVNFNFPEDVILALDDLANGATKPFHEMPLGAEVLRQMPFHDMSKILQNYGIDLGGKFINQKEYLADTLSEIGEGPYVMKAISSELVHKTELQAVRLNIANLDEASAVWEELWCKFVHLEGILIQKMEMAKSREVIIGMKRDNTFGPTILFGLGGILAEAIKDTTLRVAPIEKNEALKMMQEIKGFKILQGTRGELPVNFDLLSDIIVNLSRLSLDHPEIKEIDLNPVMASENSAVIVDARAMI